MKYEQDHIELENSNKIRRGTRKIRLEKFRLHFSKVKSNYKYGQNVLAITKNKYEKFDFLSLEVSIVVFSPSLS